MLYFPLQITDAVKFTQVLLQYGTYAEILSLNRLVRSQLSRVVHQSTGTTFIAAVESAIRNVSWDMWTERQTREKQPSGLTLPEVHEGLESDEDSGMIIKLTTFCRCLFSFTIFFLVTNVFTSRCIQFRFPPWSGIFFSLPSVNIKSE